MADVCASDRPRCTLSKAIPQNQSQLKLNDLDEGEFIQLWDEDIKRAAKSTARAFRLDPDLAQDLAQEGRIRLIHLFRFRFPLESSYVRSTLKNALLKAAKRELAARKPTANILQDCPPANDNTEISSPEDSTNLRIDISSLSPRFIRIYDLLYRQECTQQEVANILGVSQPRVSQLRRDLLKEVEEKILRLSV